MCFGEAHQISLQALSLSMCPFCVFTSSVTVMSNEEVSCLTCTSSYAVSLDGEQQSSKSVIIAF